MARKMKKSSAFPIRLLWATTPQQREKAAEIGCNWGLVYTYGHRENDFPYYYSADKKVAALRRKRLKSTIEMERKLLRGAVDHAHKLGLKAMIHCYEVSLPPEFKEVYPRLYRPEIKEYRKYAPDVRHARYPCPTDPRVLEIISEKTAETMRVVPDVDAYAFCFNECLTHLTVRHRCERCRDIPFPDMIKMLSDAVRDGVRSVNPETAFYHRLWGVNEHDDMYYENYVRRAEFVEGAGKGWLEGFVKAFKPKHLRYIPSRDLPKYLALQKDEDMGFIAKSTWADVSINHPLNPWIEHLTDHDTIVELSYEQTCWRDDSFHLLAEQFQRAARYSRDVGANGLGGMCAQWGYKPEHHGWHKADPDDVEYLKLGILNTDVFAALMNDPDADVEKVIAGALKKRYGKAVPKELVAALIESQDIKAESYNINGIRAMGENLERAYYQIMRYAPTYPDWEKRLARTPANVKKVIATNDATIARTKEIVATVEKLKKRLTPKAYKEFMDTFTTLRDATGTMCERQSMQFLLWAMKDGTVPVNMQTIMELERHLPS